MSFEIDKHSQLTWSHFDENVLHFVFGENFKAQIVFEDLFPFVNYFAKRLFEVYDEGFLFAWFVWERRVALFAVSLRRCVKWRGVCIFYVFYIEGKFVLVYSFLDDFLSSAAEIFAIWVLLVGALIDFGSFLSGSEFLFFLLAQSRWFESLQRQWIHAFAVLLLERGSLELRWFPLWAVLFWPLDSLWLSEQHVTLNEFCELKFLVVSRVDLVQQLLALDRIVASCVRVVGGWYPTVLPSEAFSK